MVERVSTQEVQRWRIIQDSRNPCRYNGMHCAQVEICISTELKHSRYIIFLFNFLPKFADSSYFVYFVSHAVLSAGSCRVIATTVGHTLKNPQEKLVFTDWGFVLQKLLKPLWWMTLLMQWCHRIQERHNRFNWSVFHLSIVLQYWCTDITARLIANTLYFAHSTPKQADCPDHHHAICTGELIVSKASWL